MIIDHYRTKQQSIIMIENNLHKFFDLMTGRWSVFLEKPIPIGELDEDRIANSLPSFGFFVLLVCSAIIATLGLISNSTAAVIGAMIVAPLMNPILSMAYGITIGNTVLIRRSMATLIIGVAVVIFTSAAITSVLPVRILGSEILTRTTPNLIDLCIAIAAGTAGAFSLTRKKIASTIAGVAIAVALVPPLCVTGIGLMLEPEVGARLTKGVIGGLSQEVAGGSFMLFLANLIGITVAGSLTLLSQSYGSLLRSWKALLAWIAIICVICMPLSTSLKKFMLVKQVEKELAGLGANWQETSSSVSNSKTIKKMQIRYINIALKGKTAIMDLVINAPEGTLDDQKVSSMNRIIFKSLKNLGIKELKANTRVVPVRVNRYKEIIQ